MKKTKYKIPVEVEVDLDCLIENTIPDLLQADPKKGAKTMKEFGNNGDWSLELEYLKLLKKDIQIDFGKEAARDLQKVINAIEKG